MDRLILERSQPVQGQPVDVTMRWNEEVVGAMVLGFTAWLKFKKLLEKGLEMDAREDHALDIKLVVRGTQVVAQGEPYAQAVYPYSNVKVALTPEDPDDAADLAAIQAAEAAALPPTMPSISPEEHAEDAQKEVTQGLIRSLRRENA